MKYVEIVLLILCINLGFSIVSAFNIIPKEQGSTDSRQMAGSIQVSDLDENYTVTRNDSLYYIIKNKLDTTKYSKTVSLLNVFQDSDFITGIWILIEILGRGIYYIGPTLNGFGVPPELHFLIMGPVYFMYMLALFQIISGRSVEGNK